MGTACYTCSQTGHLMKECPERGLKAPAEGVAARIQELSMEELLGDSEEDDYEDSEVIDSGKEEPST